MKRCSYTSNPMRSYIRTMSTGFRHSEFTKHIRCIDCKFFIPNYSIYSDSIVNLGRCAKYKAQTNSSVALSDCLIEMQSDTQIVDVSRSPTFRHHPRCIRDKPFCAGSSSVLSAPHQQSLPHSYGCSRTSSSHISSNDTDTTNDFYEYAIVCRKSEQKCGPNAVYFEKSIIKNKVTIIKIMAYQPYFFILFGVSLYSFVFIKYISEVTTVL
jgi:hypothetical protein